MDNYHQIEKLRQEIQQSSCDIGIESQLALAFENGIKPEDILVACDSFFYRVYSKDSRRAEIIEDSQRRTTLQLHLTRSGLYDQLPEGLFFQPVKSQSHITTTADMAAEYKAHKHKEQQVRRFFMPFENDFFRQRIELEKEESRLLKGLQSEALNDYFTSFWSIPASLPDSFIRYLIMLLPSAHHIAGDMLLTSRCLQTILHEDVSIRKVRAPAVETDPEDIFELGKNHLGIDTICGGQFYEDYPVLECTIGPLESSEIEDYLEGGSKYETLDTFYHFFMPVQADIITKIEVAKEKEHMFLGEEAPVLGYSSVL